MITVYRTADLNRLCVPEPLTGMLFTGEAKGHQFIITGERDHEAVSFTGSVSGRFLPPNNGSAIQFTGTYASIDSQGRAVVTLPDNCYDVTGQFGLVITNTHDGHTTVIYSAVGSVISGETNSIIDPTNTINVDAIIELMDDMQAALLECEGAASYIADTYSESGTYAVGDYVINEGNLYICNTAVTAGEAFDDTKWTLTSVTNELKGATVAETRTYLGI